MEQGLDQSLEVALSLLPLFLLIRFCQDYLQSSLQEELTLRAMITALFQGIFVLCLLLFYKELLQRLDDLIAHLMEVLGDPDTWEAYLEKCKDQLNEVKKKHPYTWWIRSTFSMLFGFIRKIFSWTFLVGLRSLIMHIRGYFLVFSTQVGPLAIVARISRTWSFPSLPNLRINDLLPLPGMLLSSRILPFIFYKMHLPTMSLRTKTI